MNHLSWPRFFLKLVALWSAGFGAGARASSSDEWEGMRASLGFLARGGTGVTSPLVELSPAWAKRQLAESSWSSENPALSSSLDEFEGKLLPIEIHSRQAGLFSGSESLQPAYADSAALRNALTGEVGNSSVSAFQLSARYHEQGISTAFGYGSYRRARLEDSGTLDYRYHRDFSAQLAAAGTVFDKKTFGRIDVGTGIKAVLRKGDELRLAAGDPTQVLSAAALKKSSFAAGLDYGILYTAPKNLTGQWVWQSALVWKDVGSTQFFLGNKTSRQRRFEALPNNQIIGLGVGTPNIWRGARGALRLEYREWKRDVSIFDKTAWGIELRFPEVLSLFGGLHGRHWSAGALLRFPNVEVEVASFASLIGERRTSLDAPRTLALELRYAF